MAQPDLGTSSTGIKPNVAALLCYVAGWITGLIFFLIEKDNKFIRFHAMQSMIVFGGLTILNFALSFILSIMQIYYSIYIIFQFIWLVALALWIVLMVKAYQGEKFKLPVAGDIAEQKA